MHANKRVTAAAPAIEANPISQLADSFIKLLVVLAATNREAIREEIQSLAAQFVPAPTEATEPQLLDVEQTAKLLGVAPQTVHEYKKKGLLPYHRLGGKVLFYRSEVLAALQAQTRPDGRRHSRRTQQKAA